MPALTNVRHERFARAYWRTGLANEAYLKAGYKPTTKGSLWTASSRLLSHVDVKRRIGELKKQMATRNRISVDSLIEDLRQDRDLARELGQPSAAIAATQLTAKLAGLLVERKETGAPGEFSGLTTPEQVRDLIKAELGPEAARLLDLALGAPEAQDEASLPDLPTPGDTIN